MGNRRWLEEDHLLQHLLHLSCIFAVVQPSPVGAPTIQHCHALGELSVHPRSADQDRHARSSTRQVGNNRLDRRATAHDADVKEQCISRRLCGVCRDHRRGPNAKRVHNIPVTG